MRMLVAAVIVGLCVVGRIAHADPISADDLAKKNEGGYVTGLPLAAYSTDIGLGAGARAYYYWNGSRDDPRFATTPYLFRMFVQAFASTRGLQFHWIDFDAPKLLDTPYRFRSQLIYARNINNNYFGIGSRSLAPLSFPGSKNYSSFSDYSTAQQTVGADGTTYSKYNQYDLEKPGGIVSLERSFLDDRVRALAGLGFTYAKIRDKASAVTGRCAAIARIASSVR